MPLLASAFQTIVYRSPIESKYDLANIWIRDVVLLSDPSTLGAGSQRSNNQITSRIQNKPKHSLPPVVCAGPVVWDSTYYGETYDARLEQKGWSQAR